METPIAENTATSGNDYIVEMQHISKSFPGIKANDDITLQLKRGEIHALLGENGAGKSTLMSVLFGLYTPEEGKILIDGMEAHIKNPNDANRYGIGMVHQHFMLVDCFTGLENIVLGAEPTDALGVLHPKKVRQTIVDLCKEYNFDVDLDARVQDMSVGMQQKVEILKMLYRNNNVLIFDEPTAVLTPQEIDELMASMKSLIKEGKSILFISHKLNEIMAVADRVTVLRKGKVIGTVNVKDTNVKELSRMMVGREVQLVVQKKPAEPGEPILSVRNLSVYSHAKHKDVVKNVSFDVRRGEITCLAGIEGNGQTELIYALTGIMPTKSGKIFLRDVDISNINRHAQKGEKGNIELQRLSIRSRNEAGLSHIPEDRHKYGLVLDFDLKSNMVLERYYEPQFSSHGWIKFKAIKDYADSVIKKYDVRSGQGSSTVTRSMSGGNQQKAIVGREMDRQTPLLIACQPTRGLDVGAIEYIHKQIVKGRDEGKGVLLLSLELEEVMNLSDRILVMYEGEIVADVDPKETTVQELGLYMSGAKRMELPVPEDLPSASRWHNLKEALLRRRLEKKAAKEKQAKEAEAEKNKQIANAPLAAEEEKKEDIPSAQPETPVAQKPVTETKPEEATDEKAEPVVEDKTESKEEAKPEETVQPAQEVKEQPTAVSDEAEQKPAEDDKKTEEAEKAEEKPAEEIKTPSSSETEEPKKEETEKPKAEENKKPEAEKKKPTSEKKAPESSKGKTETLTLKELLSGMDKKSKKKAVKKNSAKEAK